MNTLAGYVGYASHVAIKYHLVASITAVAIVGAFAGSQLGRRTDPNSLRRAFSGCVALLGIGAVAGRVGRFEFF
jgi:uncharacterized membrane protein YfcA